MNKPAAILALAALAALPPSASSAEFNTVLGEQSTLTFHFKQMNVGMAGRFRKFNAQLAFDPARAVTARVVIDVVLASIDTGSAEGDREVAGKQWFDSKTYPTARFTATHVKTLGNNRYEVAGPLSLKGRSQIITVPTTVNVQGRTATFDGAIVIKRSDFAIGEGEWADYSVVANEVRIVFHIVAADGK